VHPLRGWARCSPSGTLTPACPLTVPRPELPPKGLALHLRAPARGLVMREPPGRRKSLQRLHLPTPESGLYSYNRFPCERCVWVRNIAKVPVGRTGIQIIGDKQALRPAAQFSSAKGCPRSCQQHANVRRLPRSRAIAPRVRQVRERLPARGRWIRTFGSPTDPLRFSRQQLTEARIAVRVARLVFSRLWPVHHVGS
jgi:hypothetical protein